MKILVLGGTVFLGRHFTQAALDAGHQVTLFNRGQTNPSLFPEVEKLQGDRTVDVAPIRGREFDAVLDPSGYHPSAVRLAARAVDAAHYCFISSISAYARLDVGGFDETALLADLTSSLTEEYDPEQYGALKVLCEREAWKAFGEHALIIRPGLIVGPHDPSDRFTYWPARAARGGRILAPGPPDRDVQVIDARDLAVWIVHLLEEGIAGAFNATGPEHRLTMDEMIADCIDAAASDAGGVPPGTAIEWVPESFLLERGVQPWTELPVWLPSDGEHAGIMDVDNSRALEAGLTFRPLVDTARDTLAWDRTRPDEPRKAGLDPKREEELLAEWHT